MIISGVAFGANSPTHREIATSRPSALRLGTWGMEARRLAEKVASGRALPALVWALAAATDDTTTWALLPSSAVNAGPPPLVGKCRIWMPAAFKNSAVGRCRAP